MYCRTSQYRQNSEAFADQRCTRLLQEIGICSFRMYEHPSCGALRSSPLVLQLLWAGSVCLHQSLWLCRQKPYISTDVRFHWQNLPSWFLTTILINLITFTSFSVMSRTRLPARCKIYRRFVQLNKMAAFPTGTGWQPRSTRQVPPVTEKLVLHSELWAKINLKMGESQ